MTSKTNSYNSLKIALATAAIISLSLSPALSQARSMYGHKYSKPASSYEGVQMSLIGKVRAINKSQLALDTGTGPVKIDVSSLSSSTFYNSIKVGDTIYVDGELDTSANELNAKAISIL